MSEEIEIAPAVATHWLSVESLNLDAQGFARRPDGKVVFIEARCRSSRSVPMRTEAKTTGNRPV
jgi:hypothetical protein